MSVSEEQFTIGHHVTYVPGLRRTQARRLCLRGTVAGSPVFDAYTGATWIPVRPDGRADDVEADWVREDDIVDVAPLS
jgi:hypothetical protein